MSKKVRLIIGDTKEITKTANNQRKNIPFSIILSTLFSGFLVSSVIYYLTKLDDKQTWCNQEVKNFDIQKYNKKDLSILIHECKDELIKFKLLENILFDSNDTDKLSSITNQLYIDKTIDNKFITNFSDKTLMDYIKNSNYNFDNTLVNTRNNLPTLDKKITNYLQFTKDILFNSYSIEQEKNYFHLLLIIFQHETHLLYDKKTPTFNIPLIKYTTYEPILNEYLVNTKNICQNIGKTDKKKLIVNSEDLLYISLSELYNSYKLKNNKSILINKLILLSNLIEKNKKVTTNVGWDIFNETFYAYRIIQLILHELNDYSLNQKELKRIFKEYEKIVKTTDHILIGTTHKLIYNLFKDDFMKNKSNFLELYNDLFLNTYKTNSTILQNEFINYLAINKHVDLLLKIMKLSNDKNIKKEVFHSIINSQKINDYRVDYLDLIMKIIEDEKKFDEKKFLVRDSLELNNVEIVEFSINFINKNKEHYIKELNNEQYAGNDFYYYSIFSYLAESKPLWVAKQAHIKQIKVNLFLDFLFKIDNKNNKLNLMRMIVSTIKKDDIYLIDKVRKVILKENDNLLKNKMIAILNKV